MSGKNVNYGHKMINESTFYKNVFEIDDITVDKISKKESYGTNKSIKYFIGYNNDDVIRPLCISLPQITGYVKHFDSNQAMFFKAIDNKLLKEYNKIWGKTAIS